MPRFYRLKEIIGDRKSGIPPIIPVSRASWYAGIRAGKYPASIQLSERSVAWRESDIKALYDKLAGGI